MRKHLLAVLCALLILTLFLSCNPNASDFTGDKQQVADDLKPADLVKDILDPGAEGVDIEYELIPDSSSAGSMESGRYILRIIASFKSYMTTAGKITGGNLIYDIPGIVSGGKFSATGGCSITTKSELIVETPEGTVPVEIKVKQATIEASVAITDEGKVASISVTTMTVTTITTTVDKDEVTTPEEPEPPTPNPGGGGSGGGTVEKEQLPLSLSDTPEYTEFTIGGKTYCFNTSAIEIKDGKVADGTLVNDYCSAIKESSPVVGFAGMGNAYGFFLPLKIEDDVDDRCSISVTFMDNELSADILKSGDSYYAVILMTDIGNLKFNNEIMSIKISSSSAEYSAELELIQRPDTRTPGLLLYPTPAD